MVGLGNPGDDYAQTRTTPASGLSTNWPAATAGGFGGKREHAEATCCDWRQPRRVARPTTFYNEAGRAVSALVKRHGIDEFSRLVMVHDELDLEVGRMKLKFGGGLAGNNGLKSVRSHCAPMTSPDSASVLGSPSRARWLGGTMF